MKLKLSWLLMAVLLWPAMAQAAPNVAKLVDEAVKSLCSQCYQAKMYFISPADPENEQQAMIYHVAPELYRVEPLVGGKAGVFAYIENAEEAVELDTKSGLVRILPDRQFFTNDQLTKKFLRDLSRLPGTVVLTGMVDKINVFILRQDATPSKPYMITVGLDQRNSFPIFLLVTDAQDTRRVYYEMRGIEYLKPHQLRDDLFTITSEKNRRITQTQRFEQHVQSAAAGKAAPAPQSGHQSLPLLPGKLPKGFRVEAISQLNYMPQLDGKLVPAPVFQCEAYGPLSQLISIFMVRKEDLKMEIDEKAEKELNQPRTGYAIREKDGWVIAVFGDRDLSLNDLLEIIDGMKPDPENALKLLRQTQARDEVLQEAMPD